MKTTNLIGEGSIGLQITLYNSELIALKDRALTIIGSLKDTKVNRHYNSLPSNDVKIIDELCNFIVKITKDVQSIKEAEAELFGIKENTDKGINLSKPSDSRAFMGLTPVDDSTPNPLEEAFNTAEIKSVDDIRKDKFKLRLAKVMEGKTFPNKDCKEHNYTNEEINGNVIIYCYKCGSLHPSHNKDVSGDNNMVVD